MNQRHHHIDADGRDRGFTLVEILIAIVLVGVLSAVAVVGISSLTSKGSDAACASSVDAARTAVTTHLAMAGTQPATLAAMVASGALVLPAGATLDPSGTVATTSSFSLVMRHGTPPTFSCSLADRPYDVAARSTPGLTGYFRLGSAAETDPISGVTLTWPPGVTSVAGVIAGDPDGAAQFVANHVGYSGPYTATGVSGWDIATGSLTVAFWYRDPTPTGQAGTIVRKSGNGNSKGWTITESASGGVGCMLNSPMVGATTANGALDATWRHVTCVVDRASNVLTIYIDGAVRATESIASLAGIDLSSQVIVPSNVYGNLAGQLDELGIWSRALTAAEVASLAASR